MQNVNTKINQVIELASLKDIWSFLDEKKSLPFYFSLGRQPYTPVWDMQKELHERRKNGSISDVVLFVEHDPVYTFGKNADTNYLLNSKPKNADVVQIDRGGEVTYHGPGQLVCYPIIDLHNYRMSVSWYMRTLENVVMRSLRLYGIETSQKEGLSGVWVEDEKICAMGVRLSRWVTMHGFAINIYPNMEYFNAMIPCGIKEFGVTSFEELEINCNMRDLEKEIMNSFNYFILDSINEA